MSGTVTSRSLAWVSLLAATVTLFWSYTLPTVEFTQLASEPEIYSIWGGIEMLWLDDTPVLAAIVFLFSMVFPIGKLLVLSALLRRPRHAPAPQRTLLWVELLGKWSMLDVLIVGMFVGSIRLQLGPSVQLARGESHPGIVMFAGAIVISMLCTRLTARCSSPRGRGTGTEAGAPPPSAPGVPSASPERAPRAELPARLVSLAAGASLAAGLALPLFAVSKGFIFRNEVQLPATAWRMLQEQELVLAVSLLMFVVTLPVARSLNALWLRWRGAGPRGYRLAAALDEWAMLDVFALGLLVVSIKLEQLATTALLAGFWFTLAAAALAQLDAWMLRRDARRF